MKKYTLLPILTLIACSLSFAQAPAAPPAATPPPAAAAPATPPAAPPVAITDADIKGIAAPKAEDRAKGEL